MANAVVMNGCQPIRVHFIFNELVRVELFNQLWQAVMQIECH